jgi:hypothetical protein
VEQCYTFFGPLCIMPADEQWNLSLHANKSNKFIKSYLHEWDIHVHIYYGPETIWKVKHDVWYILLKYCMCWTVRSFELQRLLVIKWTSYSLWSFLRPPAVSMEWISNISETVSASTITPWGKDSLKNVGKSHYTDMLNTSEDIMVFSHHGSFNLIRF